MLRVTLSKDARGSANAGVPSASPARGERFRPIDQERRQVVYEQTELLRRKDGESIENPTHRPHEEHEGARRNSHANKQQKSRSQRRVMFEQGDDEVDSCGKKAEDHQVDRVSHDVCDPTFFEVKNPDRLVPHKAHLFRGAEPQRPQALRKLF